MSSEFPEERKTIDHLIQDLEDGTISPEDRTRLMEIMRSNARVRELYRKHLAMTALLHQVAESRAEMGTLPVSQDMLERETRRRAIYSLAYGMAAILILGLAFWIYHINQTANKATGPRWITVEGSADAKFAIVFSGKETRDARQLKPGDRIVVEQGLVRFSFPSGVESVVEGPSSLELVSAGSVKMDEGQAWFRVPVAGRGFAVETGGMRVVDLGTEFGLWFDGEGTQQVHVAKGRVRVEPVLEIYPKVEISAGEAMSFDPFGRGHEVSCLPSLFRREFSRRMPYAHWSFDGLIDGGFAAEGNMPGIETCRARVLRLDGKPADLPASQTTGRFGAALSLDGNGRYAETSFPGIGGNAPRTFAAWVRYRQGVMAHNGITPFCAWGNRSPGKLWKIYFRQFARKTAFMTSIMKCEHFAWADDEKLGDWIHIACVYTGRSLENGDPEIILYINGVRQASEHRNDTYPVDTDVSSPDAHSLRFGTVLGSGPGDHTLDADIDEAWLFRGVLDDAQIRQLMDANRLE